MPARSALNESLNPTHGPVEAIVTFCFTASNGALIMARFDLSGDGWAVIEPLLTRDGEAGCVTTTVRFSVGRAHSGCDVKAHAVVGDPGRP